MTVPRAVREQAERAEQLRKQRYEQPQSTDTDADPALAPGDGNQHEKQTDNPSTTRTPDATPEPAPADASADLDERYRKLEQAHRALQGKYNAEVPRLTQQLREANDKLVEAQKQANQAESKASEAQQKLQQRLVQLREEYGDELADTMELVATAKQDTPQASQQEGGSPQDRFMRSLLRQVPDFEAVNTSPEFVQWLKNPNPNTGLSYQQELNEAGADLDVLSVAEIVRAFKGAQAKANQPNANAPENQIAPDRRNPQQQMKRDPAYTAKDFAKLQQEIAMGKWRGREADARALEAKIHAALTGQSQT